MAALIEQKTFLVSAYACEPNEGSEPGVGWNWAVELSKHHRVIVITRANNKEKIEQVLKEENHPNLSFVYCEVPRYLAFWKKGQRGVHLYYVLWQYLCYQVAKKICKEQKVDYALTVTFGNMWMPTFMYKLPCKFIWGPIGGGEGVPKCLWSRLSGKQQLIEQIRTLNQVIPVTNPWLNATCKKAELIIVRTEDTYHCIKEKYHNKCDIMIETGISEEDISYFKDIIESDLDEKNKNDYLLCGKMVPYKLFDLAVDAFAKAERLHGSARLHIVGDGPRRKIVESLIEKYRLQDSVILEGKLPREKTLKLMASCKALLLTSAREGGSWVMFEAMLLKKPIICFNTSGMHIVVTDETGYLLPVTDYDTAIEAFANALLECSATDLKNKGEAAYARVSREFTWEAKVNKMLRRIGEYNE